MATNREGEGEMSRISDADSDSEVGPLSCGPSSQGEEGRAHTVGRIAGSVTASAATDTVQRVEASHQVQDMRDARTDSDPPRLVTDSDSCSESSVPILASDSGTSLEDDEPICFCPGRAQEADNQDNGDSLGWNEALDRYSSSSGPPSLASSSGFDSDLDMNSSRHGTRPPPQLGQLPNMARHEQEGLEERAEDNLFHLFLNSDSNIAQPTGIEANMGPPMPPGMNPFFAPQPGGPNGVTFVTALGTLSSVTNLSSFFGSDGSDDLMQQLLQASFNAAQAPKPQAHPHVLHWLMTFQIAEGDEVECPISAALLEPGEWAARMPCGHYFSQPLLLQWLEQSNACPTCRFELPTTDGQYNQQHSLSVDSAQDVVQCVVPLDNDLIGNRVAQAKRNNLQALMTQAWRELCADSCIPLDALATEDTNGSAATMRSSALKCSEVSWSALSVPEDEALENALIETLRKRQKELESILNEDTLNS